MYLQELVLYNILKNRDTKGLAGVTITEMKEILADHEQFQFPEKALSAAFKRILNAEFDRIDPESIIDVDEFIVSLHKEFAEMAQKKLSQVI